ncbi:hypothetical protein ACWEQ8_17850 [Streptomyces noursei]
MAAAIAAGSVLVVVGDAAGLQFAFAGNLPVTIDAERIVMSDTSIEPTLSTGNGMRTTLALKSRDFRADNVCVRSSISVPAIGEVTVRLFADHVSSSDVTIDTAGMDASDLEIRPARTANGIPGSGTSLTPFQLNAGSFTAARIRFEPQTFAATLIASGFHVDFTQGRQECPQT